MIFPCRNNPFLEREVQKSASACQLSRRDQTSVEKRLEPAEPGLDGVLKSHSANALHPEKKLESPLPMKKLEKSQETIKYTTASTDTIVPDLTKDLPETNQNNEPLPILRQVSDTIVPSLTILMQQHPERFERSISSVESSTSGMQDHAATAKVSDRTARIRAARERFLSSPTVQMRREGTSSASDLRPGDRYG